MRRHLGQRHFDALLLEDGEGELIAVVEDRRRLVHLADAAQGGDVGKALAEPDEEPDPSAERQDAVSANAAMPRRHDARMPASSLLPFALELVDSPSHLECHHLQE